ncbi:type IV pilus modification protein PilV [Methylobacter sp. S3L5C]|uniref:type IV pilus modification protein PilV n=1 Tax=Methylobacter sp. S3L5C TaxID=2839024 RepID=UPI001FAC86AF|nr:type IV pilus modification protein PilV [Methylobacter sp. S3L5C]
MTVLKLSLVLTRHFRVMNKSAGFTLIEVLIAMVVLAVGLLGLAGLQATSLRNNQSAYTRSQATQLSYDLAERMRANIAGKVTYTSISPSSANANANCLTSTGCSPVEMAENDLYQWNLAVASALPGGVGTVAIATGVYTVSINWDDNRDGNTDSNDPNFQTRFQL